MRLAEAGLGGDFEGQRVRVDVVVAAVGQRRAEVHGRDSAPARRLPSGSCRPFSTDGTNSRGTEPPTVSSTNSKPVPRSQRLERDPHFGELAGAAGLLLVDVLFVDRLA